MMIRPVAALLLVLVPLHLTACAHVPAYRLEPHAFPGNPRDTLAVQQLAGEAVRVQLLSGRLLRLDNARVLGDTIFGSSVALRPDSAAAVPLDSIAAITIRRVDHAANLARGAATAYSASMVLVAIGGVILTVLCLKWLSDLGNASAARSPAGR